MAKKTVKMSEVNALVARIEQSKAAAKELYASLDADSEALLDMLKHGYEIVTEVKEEGSEAILYKRVRITDNAELLKQGKPLFKSTAFKRCEVEIDYLKHPPKKKEA